MRACRLLTAAAFATAGLMLVSLATATPTLAADDYFDWSCNDLYEARNGIYKDGGYCFKTKRAIKKFGNAGCSYDDVGDVPLSSNQRKVIKRIVAAEKSKGC